MLTVTKKIIIYRKADASEFSKKNYKVLPVGVQKIGSSINAVNAITLHSDMLGELMPSILGISKDQREFTKAVNMYWNSISVNIPDTGKQFEIGFIYDLKDTGKFANIKQLKGADGKPKEFITDQQLADYVENYVPEDDKWMYGKPINTSDYLLWRYCLNYKAVANSPDTSHKSGDIRFYIHNENEIKKMEKDKFDIRKKAGQIYFDVIADPANVKLYLYALGKGSIIGTMDELDQAKLLESVYTNTPNDLIEASKDKQLKQKAYIEECITVGVLRRLTNSTVIVNASDNTPIGNNIDEAIAFLKVDTNAKLANEIEGRLRALPK